MKVEITEVQKIKNQLSKMYGFSTGNIFPARINHNDLMSKTEVICGKRIRHRQFQKWHVFQILED